MLMFLGAGTLTWEFLGAGTLTWCDVPSIFL